MVRFKNRYFLCELVWEGEVPANLEWRQVQGAINKSIRENFGDYGAATCGHTLSGKYFNPQTGLCIIRCSRDVYEKVWAAMTLVTHINKRSVLINTIHVSGTIRTCQQHAAAHAKEVLRCTNVFVGNSTS